MHLQKDYFFVKRFIVDTCSDNMFSLLVAKSHTKHTLNTESEKNSILSITPTS